MSITAHSSQLTAHSSQLTAHSSQLTAHSSQLLGWCHSESSPCLNFFPNARVDARAGVPTPRLDQNHTVPPAVNVKAEKPNSIHSASRGFTLIELMTVVVLLGIFAGIALPSFNNLVANNRVESTASEFYGVLMSARSDAVTKRASATVAKVDDQNWEVIQSNETVSTLILPGNVTLASTTTSLIFKPDGTAATASLNFGSDQSDRSYIITVHPSGAIRLSGPLNTTPSP